MILTATEEQHNQSTLCSCNSTQHKTVQFCTTLTFDPLRSSIKSRNTQMYLLCEVLSEYHASFQMQQLTRSPFFGVCFYFQFLFIRVFVCVSAGAISQRGAGLNILTPVARFSSICHQHFPSSLNSHNFLRAIGH